MVRKVKGFSIIEALVVIAVLSILMWIAVGPLRSQILKSRLHEAVNMFVADINDMKRRAITEDLFYGIHIANSNYYLTFVDSNKNCSRDSGEDITSISLPSGVSVLPTNATIVWTRKGVPLNSNCSFYAGTITFRALGFTKRVVINRYGRIRIE